MLRAVITAGGRVHGADAAAMRTTVKALAPLGAGRLIDPILTALADCGLRDPVVIGDAAVARAVGRRARIIAAAASGTVNVQRALELFPGDDLLFCTSDLPFVDGAALRAFINASAAFDLTMPIASDAAYEAAYPGAPPHLTTLGDKRVANGSVFFLRAAARPAVAEVASAFFDARKSPLRMARLLGPALMLRFALRRLTIAAIEVRACAVLGIRAAAIADMPPSLAFDVDDIHDYRYACENA